MADRVLTDEIASQCHAVDVGPCSRRDDRLAFHGFLSFLQQKEHQRITSARTLTVVREDSLFLANAYRIFAPDRQLPATGDELLLDLVASADTLGAFFEFLYETHTPTSGTSRRYNLNAVIHKATLYFQREHGHLPSSFDLACKRKRDAAKARTKSYKMRLTVPAQKRQDFLTVSQLRQAAQYLRQELQTLCVLPLDKPRARSLHRHLLCACFVLVATQRSQVFVDLRISQISEGLQHMRFEAFSRKTGAQYALRIPSDLAQATRFWLGHGRDLLIGQQKHDYVFLRVTSGRPLLKPYATVKSVMFQAIGKEVGPASIRRNVATSLAVRSQFKGQPTEAKVDIPGEWLHEADTTTTATLYANPTELNAHLATVSGHSSRTRRVVYTMPDANLTASNAFATSAMEDLLGGPSQSTTSSNSVVIVPPRKQEFKQSTAPGHVSSQEAPRGRRRKWTEMEVTTLRTAVAVYGPHYSDILRHPDYRDVLARRRPVDLAEKWKRLTKAKIAQ